MQDERGEEWHQLAQRVFQDFSGLGKGLSASEKQDVERAANAKPWVHKVNFRHAPPLMHSKTMHCLAKAQLMKY